MTKQEFIKKMKSVPWVNRAVGFDAVDCFGLVIMYYRHVLGIKVPNVNGFSEDLPMDECWDNADTWEQVDTPPIEGLAFTAYKGDTPMHVGIVISPTHVLHCRGDFKHHGKVEMHSIRAIKRTCGKITYHRLKGQ